MRRIKKGNAGPEIKRLSLAEFAGLDKYARKYMIIYILTRRSMQIWILQSYSKTDRVRP